MKILSVNKYLKPAVIGILLLRLLLVIFIPLLDKTEARYGEIARLMHQTQDWVVLQIDYGKVFWAKPPLSTWLSALSFEVFGINEFASRLPSYLLCIVIIVLVIKALRIKKADQYIPAFILLTTPEFLLHAGVTSTDTTLLFAISLIMLSFWRTMQDKRISIWSYLFFVGVGLGLLAKGPIAIMLTGPPIFVWSLLQKGRFRNIFKYLPWIIGLLIVAIIALPWYYLTEKQSPGFFDYFIVGEHFKRFTESGWSGDKYGFAKSQPLGMVWVFLLGFGFPWILIAIYYLVKQGKSVLKHPWLSYLLFWMLWTPIFFTVSRNVIHTYILPSTVPLALLIYHWWQHEKHWVKVASIFPLAIALALCWLTVTNGWQDVMNTEKYVLQHQDITRSNKDVPVIYWRQNTYSGRFYANKQTRVIDTKEQQDSLANSSEKFFFLLLKDQQEEIKGKLKEQLIYLESNPKRLLYTNKE